jgi:hypothetical protein
MKLYIPFALDCEQQLKDFCYDYLDKNWNFRSEKIFRIDIQSDIVKMLDQELSAKGLPSTLTFSIFSRGKGNKQGIHIDTAGEGWTIWKSGIYIPLMGMAGSKLRWFKPETGEVVQQTTLPHVNSTGSVTKRLAVVYQGKLPLLEEKEFSSCHIINTVIPHRAEASPNEPRASLTIRLQTNPDLIKMFSPDEQGDTLDQVPTI